MDDTETFQPKPSVRFSHLARASYFERVSDLCFGTGIPRLLYKYKNVNESYLRDYLVNSRLYLSSRNQLNDPFDVKSDFVFGGGHKAVEKYLRRLKKDHKLTKKEVKPLTLKFRTPKQAQNELRSSFEQILDSSGLHSFAISPRSLLMWSHYSDSHRGICLVFDVIKDIDVFVPAMQVSYDSNYPIVDYGDEFGEVLAKKAFLTKAKDWEYEKERRIFVVGKAKTYMRFIPQALVGIILGCQISDADRKVVSNLIMERKSKM